VRPDYSQKTLSGTRSLVAFFANKNTVVVIFNYDGVSLLSNLGSIQTTKTLES